MRSPGRRRREVLTAAIGLCGTAGCLGGRAPGGDTSTTRGEEPEAPTAPTDSSSIRDDPSTASTTAWPQEGSGPGHGGTTPASGVPTDGEVRWTTDHTRSGSPLVAHGRLYHYGRIVGPSDETTGPTSSRPATTSTGPYLHPPKYPPGAEKHLFCRDAESGEIQWTRPVAFQSRWPVLADGAVVAAGTGVVVAFDAVTGEELWRHDLGDRMVQATTADDGVVFATSQIVRKRDRRADVRAYRVADGERRWTRSAPRWQPRVAAGGDTLLSLSAWYQGGTVLTARDLPDGTERWRVEIDDVGLPKRPVVAGETAYVSSDDQGVRAFDVETSELRWHEAAATSNVVEVAATDDTAYLAEQGQLRVHDAEAGTERWSVSTGVESDFSGLSVGREAVYLGTGSGDLLALSRDDGTERWRYGFPEVTHTDVVVSGLTDSPIVVDDAVVAPAEDGLYRFESTSAGSVPHRRPSAGG